MEVGIASGTSSSQSLAAEYVKPHVIKSAIIGAKVLSNMQWDVIRKLSNGSFKPEQIHADLLKSVRDVISQPLSVSDLAVEPTLASVQTPATLSGSFMLSLRKCDSQAVFNRCPEYSRLNACEILENLEEELFSVNTTRSANTSVLASKLTAEAKLTFTNTLMLSRIFSWNIHEEFGRETGNYANLAKYRANFKDLLYSAVNSQFAGESEGGPSSSPARRHPTQTESRQALYFAACSVAGSCALQTEREPFAGQDQLIEAGLRIGFVTQLLAATNFSFTAPDLKSIRHEVYRALIKLEEYANIVRGNQ